MTSPVTLLIVLLSAGLLLFGAEIFIPGAVVGTLGMLCLVGGVVVAFTISAAAGLPVDDALRARVRRECPVPQEFDFRMHVEKSAQS